MPEVVRFRNQKDPQTSMDLSGAVGAELRKLLKHSSHYLAGLVGALALGFVSFPIFTRVFSVTDYGTIDLVQKILLLVVACSKMGLQNSALRFYDGHSFALSPEAGRRYYSTMFFGMALTASTLTVLFLAGVAAVPATLIGRPLTVLLYLGSGLIFLRAMESILWSFLRIEERTKAYNVATVVLKAATIAAVCLFLLWLGRSASAFFAGAIGVEVLLVAVMSLLLFRRGMLSPAKFDGGLFRTAVAFGTPLILYEVASVALITADRVLVRYYLGGEALGLYSVAFGLSFYLNDLLIAPLNLALLPIYMRLWTSEGRERTIEFLSVGLDVFLMAAAGVFAVAVVTSRDAVTLLASSKYHGASGLMPMLVASLLIYTTHVFLSAGLLIHKKTGAMARLLVYSAAVNIGLNCVLLPRIGLQGAAVATLVSYAVCVLLLGRASFKILPLRIPLSGPPKYALAALVAMGAASRIELGSAILNLPCRSAVAVLLYIGVMYALDSRVRTMARRLLPRRQALTNPEGAEVMAVSER